MEFYVVSSHSKISEKNKPCVFLVKDSWDDWFKYNTLYDVVVIDEQGARHELGGVKIAQAGQETRRPDISNSFRSLGEEYFSLGQDESYYGGLNNLGDSYRKSILSALNDLALHTELLEKYRNEDVVQDSLLRFVTRKTVIGQFRRMANGGARLTDFEFSYTYPRRKSGTPILKFRVVPESTPPTNVHVLIGRNGVGKTRCLTNMAKAVVVSGVTKAYGIFENLEDDDSTELFSNVISVAFSAFDSVDPIPPAKLKASSISYRYIGIRRDSSRGGELGSPKSPRMLEKEFVESMKVCLQGARKRRWIRAISALEQDHIFSEAQVSELADTTVPDWEKDAGQLFKKLSSGHKIVLLTITRLVEAVEEKSLVLIDEPEGHLHPPLLSAFVRALSDLLVDRNGVALIATHSPVILQEVPAHSAYLIDRIGEQVSISRPTIETFGENVGILTREVFGLEVTKTGFHKLLKKSVQQFDDFDELWEEFDGKLGAEAQAIARVLYNSVKKA